MDSVRPRQRCTRADRGKPEFGRLGHDWAEPSVEAVLIAAATAENAARQRLGRQAARHLVGTLVAWRACIGTAITGGAATVRTSRRGIGDGFNVPTSDGWNGSNTASATLGAFAP